MANAQLRNFLLTGATGFIGSDALCRLHKASPTSQFYLLVRKKPDPQNSLLAMRIKEWGLNDLWPRLHFVECDFLDRESFSQGLKTLTIPEPCTVVHMAAIISLNHATAENQLRVNVGVTADLLDWARKSATHFVFTSSMAAFGASVSPDLRSEADFENFPVLCQRFSYFITKRQAHEQVLKEKTLPVTLLCPSIVHGSLENFKDSRGHLKALRDGKLRVAPAGGANFVGLDRVSNAIMTSALEEVVAGRGAKTQLLLDQNLSYFTYFNLYLKLYAEVGEKSGRPRPKKLPHIWKLPKFLSDASVWLTERIALPGISSLAQAGLFLFFESKFAQAPTEGLELQLKRSFS